MYRYHKLGCWLRILSNGVHALRCRILSFGGNNGLGVGCAGGFTVDECHCDRVASAPMLKRNLEREMQVQEAADLVAMMLVYVRGSAMAQLAT